MSATQHKTATAKKEEAVSRIRIKIRAYDSRIIDQATKTIVETAERHDAKVVGPVPLPTEKMKFTVNRSTFVHKDAREQFEMRVHKRLIDILNASPKCIDALMSLNFQPVWMWKSRCKYLLTGKNKSGILRTIT